MTECSKDESSMEIQEITIDELTNVNVLVIADNAAMLKCKNK